MNLKAADASEGATRRANLGGKIRERRDVVSEQGAGARELLARELHAVARVAGEPHGGARNLVDFFMCLGDRIDRRRGHDWLDSLFGVCPAVKPRQLSLNYFIALKNDQSSSFPVRDLVMRLGGKRMYDFGKMLDQVMQ